MKRVFQQRDCRKVMVSIVRCRVNSIPLFSEEHKGGSESLLNLWSDPHWYKSNQIDGYLGVHANKSVMTCRVSR